jgi:hypothetical protein
VEIAGRFAEVTSLASSGLVFCWSAAVLVATGRDQSRSSSVEVEITGGCHQTGDSGSSSVEIAGRFAELGPFGLGASVARSCEPGRCPAAVLVSCSRHHQTGYSTSSSEVTVGRGGAMTFSVAGDSPVGGARVATGRRHQAGSSSVEITGRFAASFGVGKAVLVSRSRHSG